MYHEVKNNEHLYELIKKNCVNKLDCEQLWHAITKEHVVVTDINQFESNMFESKDKLPQGLPESCVITNLINNDSINTAVDRH